MHKKFPCNRKAITIGVILAGLSTPVLAQDVEVEEVVVTGSFIRGSAIDAPSPVQVVDRASIEAQGAAIIWDVIKNLEVNSGSFTNSGSGERSQVEGTAQVNLRNLGENSTLTLINGKRVAPYAAITNGGGEFVDINAIPLVMTDRVEILTDGGSALYGADAVAGVVNVIMRTDFEGLELYGDIQGVEAAGDAYDTTLSGIWGWASDSGDTHLVLSAERFERDAVNVLDGNHIDENSQFNGSVSTVSGSGIASPFFGANINPAYVRQDIMDFNLAQGGDGGLVLGDPLCESLTDNLGRPFYTGSLRETRGERDGTCREEVSRFNFLSRDTERTSFAAAFDHTFSEAAEFYAFANYMENEIILEGGGLNNTGGSSTTRGPTVQMATPGSYIGNPAFGGFAIGAPSELGYYAPLIGLAAPTAADIPNNPNSLANGGPNITTIINPRDGIPRDGKRSNFNTSESSIVQAGLRGDFDYRDRPWSYDVGVSWSQSSNEQTYQTFNRERTELAALGLGGENCTPNGRSDFDWQGVPSPLAGFGVPGVWDLYGGGYTQTFFPNYVLTTRESMSLGLTSNNQGQGGCEFYNPYLTQFTDPNLANSPELMGWLNETVLRADKRNTLAVFDAVVGGELFDMAGGPAAIAFGAQYRERRATSKAPALNFPGIPNAILGYDDNGVPDEFHKVDNNFECANCIFNFDHERTTSAAFFELALPFMENVETQIAVRYEDYGGNIGSEVSPKFAMSWRPIESLLLRGSFSQSFRAPNIGIVEEGLEASGTTFNDPISNQAVRAGLLPPTPENGEPEFSFTLGGPAPNVGNEYADTFNAGFLWTPAGRLEGLSVGADVWRFEVSDRVLPEPAISAVQPEIDRFLTVVGDPNNYILNDSISTDSPVLDVPCNPNDVAAQFGVDSAERLNCVVNPTLYTDTTQGVGISRLFRNESATLITLTLAAINAGQIEADGVDVKLGYNWDNDWGRFRLSMDYTHVNQYKLIGVPGLELGLNDTGKLDAAGTSGNGLHVRSLPDNKGNITLSWQQDRHGVTVINRHIGSYQDLSHDFTFETGNDLVRSLLRPKIDSYNTWDVQYRYAHDWGNARLGTTNFTVGILDMFDEDLPYREAGGNNNYDATVFDPRGRRLYARALWSF
ncbi:MAG: iron complex outermembrane receptor protein [Pseudohongiellaceae bacterium]|jgi:iron complex outermembrane receptor protein